MALLHRSPDCAGILAGWFVLLLLAVRGTAFAPQSTAGYSTTKSEHLRHQDLPIGWPLISTQISQRRHINLLCRPVSLQCANAISTPGGEEVVHAISQVFLAELEASGRVLAKRDKNWWARFGELEDYKQEVSDCNVPRKFEANPQLGIWVFNQRRRYQQKKLSSERIEALESMGFEWTRPLGKLDDEQWWKRLGELKEYKQMRSDCNVPISYEVNPQLSNWVMNQRACYHRFFDENWKQNPGITKERIDALNEIGFEWRLRDRPEWDERYDELLAYKEEHGDTLVPMDARGDSDNKYHKLAMWVNTQRREYRLLQKGKHSQLTDERIEKLNQIGFVWSVFEAAWEEKFAELDEFKAAHGHTDVPSSWEDQELFWWVSVQRREYRKLKEGKMTGIIEERIERLDGIGFEWRSKLTYRWKKRLGELRYFYDENGVVPVPRAKHSPLYSWVWNQKKEYDKFVRGEKTNMDEERIKDLESIGFFDVYGK